LAIDTVFGTEWDLHTVLSVMLISIGLVGFTRTQHTQWVGFSIAFGILASYGRLGITYGIDLDWIEHFVWW
jgi:hypothetical protein